MKNILFILLLLPCFAQSQTYGWMISKDPAQNADTANVLVMFPTGFANQTGRGHFISYETFAALIDPYITGGGGGTNMATANQTITGDRAHNLGGNDFKYQNLDDGRFVIDYNSSKDSAYLDLKKDTFDVLLDGGGGLGKFARMFLGAANVPEYFVQVDDGLGGTSEINISPTQISFDADSYYLLTNPPSGASTDSIVTINASTGAIRMVNHYDFIKESNGYYWITNHGAIADDGTNDRVAIQALLDYVEGIGGGVVVVPYGVFNVTYNAYNEGLYIGDHTTLMGFGEGSEIRYTGHASVSSTAIQNRRSSGQYSDFQQRTGNVDIHIKGIKLTFTERDDFKNIGINLSGVDWGSIKDTWVDSCGGYSYLIGRTNDTDTLGNFSENVILDNLKVTNMMDVGVEIWGAENVTARNLDISGRGTDVGYGQGIYVWNGAKNVHIYNARIQKDTNDYDAIARHMIAFTIGSIPLGDTITNARKTQNVTFENIDSRTDIGFAINKIHDTVALHRIDSIFIRNCNFLGYDTIRDASDIRWCKTLVIEGCTFDRFAKHLQFSTTSNTTMQNSVSDVVIRNNQFTWGEGIDFYGITDFSIVGNQFYNLFDAAPIVVRGGRNGIIKNNQFLNIGSGTDQWCITLNKLNASEVRETRLIEVTGNTACDDRASRNTDDLVVMTDATDSITVRFNVLDCADSDADQVNNGGTGTAIFTTELGLQDHDWYEEGTTRAPNAITDNIFTEAPQVGMGTNAPATNLHVLGGGTVIARVESTAGQAQVSIKGTSLGQIENTTGHLYVTNAASGGDLILRADGSTEKLRLSGTNATFADDVIIPADAYGVGWNGVQEAAPKDGVYDQVQLKLNISDTTGLMSTYIDRSSAETIYGVKTFNADPIVPAEAYAVGWNGSNEPPTKNDVYDKIETLGGSSGHTIRDDGSDETARTGLNFVSTSTINMVGTDDAGNNETEILANVIAGSIGDTELASSLDATQLADGTVTSTEFQYINTLSSNAQTQLDAMALRAGRSGGQTLIGGTATTDDLILQSTSGVGATGALIQAKVGNNGGTTAWTVLNNGRMGLQTITNPVSEYLEMPGSTTGSSLKVGAFECQSYALNNGWLSDNIYYTSGTGFTLRSTGFGCMSYFYNGAYQIRVTANSGSAGSTFTPKIPFIVNRNSSISLGGDVTTGVGHVGSKMMIDSIGKVGINTSVADKQLEINLGTAEAFRLSYNDNNGSAAVYADQTLSSAGVVTLNAVGSASSYVFTDPFANTATSLTLGAAATTFALTSNVMTITGNGGGNTLATITGGLSGQILTLIFADALVTITDDASGTASTINISAAFTSTANDVMMLVHNGTSWREVSRSVN